MRPSSSRAVSDPPREGRLREAGLSGARALTRLLVALIENLGAQDKVGRRREPTRRPGWPHGTHLAAFGPTPLGDEIERVMRKAANPLRVAPGYRDALTGLPVLDEIDEAQPETWPATRAATPEWSEPAEMPPPAAHLASDEVPT